MEETPLSRTSRAWREVDGKALAHNARLLQDLLAPGCRLMAVVKAEAYGHGAVWAARTLEAQGVDAFAVACLSEGIALRRAGISGVILVLGWTPPEQAPLLAAHGLTQAVADTAHGLALSAQGVELKVHLALDTGMHRLGIPAEDAATIAHMFTLPHLKVEGVFSHLCVSDGNSEQDRAFTARQLEVFYRVAEELRRRGLDPGVLHIQASYGLCRLPPQPCQYARPGIALYGAASSPDLPLGVAGLEPVLSLRARVASVRTLPAGCGAGYGLAFQAMDDRRLAVVSIGYADGLPRALSQRGGQVLLGGTRRPMVGRMCMDQLLVDVTEGPEVAAGDVATLIGRDGGARISAEEVARQCGTIANELLSRLGPRLPVVPLA